MISCGVSVVGEWSLMNWAETKRSFPMSWWA